MEECKREGKEKWAILEKPLNRFTYPLSPLFPPSLCRKKEGE